MSRSFRYKSIMDCQVNSSQVRYGLETALYRAPQLWSLVLEDLKSLPHVNLFKSKIKHWECTEYPCKLCKTYLKTQIMFNVSWKSIKPCKKVTRISELYQTFLYAVFQSSIRSAFRNATKHLRSSFNKNRPQMLPASIINVYT